jgi:DNA (cytosine-5)-methyltransferase 1
MSIPVIDLFSGPGGLGEGFAGLNDGKDFHIVVSAEMDEAAHKTLQLRSFYRLLKANGGHLQTYYDYCNGIQDNPATDRTAGIWKQAEQEARRIELGTTEGNRELDGLLHKAVKTHSDCVLIGGPPCQAYSLVGRSRNRGKKDYCPEDDHRHFLYREYLRVLQKVRPAVFVMENVKGILSSRVGESRIFHDILLDLVDPDAALTKRKGHEDHCYRICSLVTPTQFRRGMDVGDIDVHDFVIRAEEHGIPQARHRVILLGIREDINKAFSPLDPAQEQMTVRDAIGDLPKLRSRMSKTEDSPKAWSRKVADYMSRLGQLAEKADMKDLSVALAENAGQIAMNLECGKLRMPLEEAVMNPKRPLAKKLADPHLKVILNHEARGHMGKDLRRYAYASTFALVHGISPKGYEQFGLHGLAPHHKNWKTGHFADRFRVQVWGHPATTVTSHIAKDGHYFIHPDPAQCRSLTVREAARLQTFSDNYFFQGNRTQQFHQVGNAVPPMLASMIARVVGDLLS